MVASSWMLMRSEPSPVSTTTGVSGFARAAPMAAGTEKPMVPRPPEVRKLRGAADRPRLRRPHLVLAHVHGHDAFPGRHGRQLPHQRSPDASRHPDVPRGVPSRMASISRLHSTRAAFATSLFNRRKRAFHVAFGADVRAADFPYLRLIDIHVDDAGARGEACNRTGGPVIEPHAQRNQQVGPVHGQIGGPAPMHSEHSQVQRVVRLHDAKPHQGADHGIPQAAGERADLLLRTGGHHAASDVQHRPLGRRQSTGPWRQGLRRRAQGRVCHARGGKIIDVDEGLLDILGHVDQDRARPAGERDPEGLGHDLQQSRRRCGPGNCAWSPGCSCRRCPLPGRRRSRSGRTGPVP